VPVDVLIGRWSYGRSGDGLAASATRQRAPSGFRPISPGREAEQPHGDAIVRARDIGRHESEAAFALATAETMRLRRQWLPAVVICATMAAALAIGVAVANRFAGPLPPRRLVISTGRPDGAYYQYALEYQRLLAAQGFALDIQPGPGSIATLQRLAAGEVDAGFVQGGTATAPPAGVTALGSLFYEPLWIFYRRDLTVSYLSDLRGRRLAVGEVGSGTRELTLRLLADNGVTDTSTHLLSLGGGDAEAALTSGAVDAAFFVVSPRAELVQRLLSRRDIALVTDRRHLAYAGRHRFVASLRIGEGMLDMARNIPPADRIMVGVTAVLAVRDVIHPDLVRLLLGAAERVHRKGGLLERPGQFPSDENLELPLHDQARRYLRAGPSWLERTFPFWVAGILDRSVLMILPGITLMLPLFGLVLPLLDRRHRRRLARRYRLLRESWLRGESPSPEAVHAEIQYLKELRRTVIEDADVPPMYFGEVFHLTMHIDLVLERLERGRHALVGQREVRRGPPARVGKAIDLDG
jgi:TRAP transporter TAXI family solute receptor